MAATVSHPSHPDRDSLARYLAPEDEGARGGASDVENHLRDGCLSCLLSARDLLSGSGHPRSHGADGIVARDRSISLPNIRKYALRVERKAFLIEAENGLVTELAAELMLKAPLARRTAVREGRRYQFLALSDFVRAESRKEISRDLARAMELAELSAEIADCLDTGFYGRRLVADARALAWALVGNGRRIAGDFFGAERVFQCALRFLDAGTGGPSEQAEVSSLLASLRLEQSRFSEATCLLSQAAATYRALEQPRREGKILLQLGNTASLSGDPSRALRFFESSLDLLHPEDDRWLRLHAHHNIVTCLNEIGASADASKYLTQIAPLYEEFAEDRAMQMRRRWQEGLIAAGLGLNREAVATLMEVRKLYLDQEKAFETAQVTLDLAAALLTTGDLATVKQVVKEIYPVFRSQEIHREAIAALLLFERAVAAETATAALAQDVAQYLTRARNNPYMKYEPQAPIED